MEHRKEANDYFSSLFPGASEIEVSFFFFFLLLFFSCSPLCFFVLSWQQTQQAFSVFKNAGSPEGSWNYVLKMSAHLFPLLLPHSPGSCRWQTYLGLRQPLSHHHERDGVQMLHLLWSNQEGQWDTWNSMGSSSTSCWTLGFVWFP